MPNVLLTIADGNLTDATKHALVDATSYLDSEAVASGAVPSSPTASSAFTPGAITVSGFACKLRNVAGTGTLTATLRNNTDSVDVGTVTINFSDLPAGSSSTVPIGWVYFEFGAPVLLVAGKAYVIRLNVTGGSGVVVFTDATANNWSRLLVTTTLQAPAAGDKLVVCGRRTGAGVSATRTVTMDSDGTTTYGAVVCSDLGTVNWPTTGGITRNLKISGFTRSDAVVDGIQIFLGGAVNIGTAGTSIPANSLAIIDLVVGANVAFGIEIRGGTFKLYGYAKGVTQALLNADAAAAATALTADRTLTDWQSGDLIGIAPTGTVTGTAECEAITLNADAIGAGFVLSSGLGFAHKGTAAGSYPQQAELINLTRNIRIRGATSALGTYINVGAGTTVVWRYAEFKWMGSATTGKRGIDLPTGPTAPDIQFCSFREFGFDIPTRTVPVSNTVCLAMSGSSAAALTISNNVGYGFAQGGWINSGSGSLSTINNNWGMCSVGNTFPATPRLIFTNNRVSGSSQPGIIMNASGLALLSFSGNVAHNNAGSGIRILNAAGGVVQSCVGWRNSNHDLNLQGTQDNLTVDQFYSFGSVSQNVHVDAANYAPVLFTSCFFGRGPSSFTLAGVAFNVGTLNAIFRNCTFEAASIVDFPGTGWPQLTFDNCLFSNSPVGTNNTTNRFLDANVSYIAFHRYNRVTGDQRYYRPAGSTYGLLTRDTTIKDAGASSQRLAPLSASVKLESGKQTVPVASGGTATVTVRVRKSVVGDGAAYNGNQPRLILKQHYASGVTVDTVLATAAGAAGSFETLTGTTPAIPNDGVFELLVDCDGTAGWVNVDTWTVTGSATDANGTEKYWRDGVPFQMLGSTLTSIALVGGTMAGVGAVTGTLKVTRRLSGAPAGVGACAGTLKVSRRFHGSAAGVGAVTGTLKVSRRFSGSAAGVGAVTGTLKVTRRFSGSAAGVGAVTGTLKVTRRFHGAAAGLGAVTGTLKVTRRFHGSAAGVGAATGTLKVTRRFHGSAAGVGTITGRIYDFRTVAKTPTYARVVRNGRKYARVVT